MKTKIIFFDTFDNIIIDNMIGIEDSGCKKYYKKLKEHIIEIIYCTHIDKVDRIISIDDMNRCIFIIKEINDNNINLVRDMYHRNITIAAGMSNLSNLNYKDNCEFLNDIIYFPQLVDDSEFIDLDLFIFAVKNKLFNINHKPEYILFGKEEEKTACGRIPIFILKRFDKIQGLKYFHLKLYNKNEMNIEEISYIEDCIREYIKDGSALKIDQMKNNSDENKIYFFLSAQ